MTKHPLRSRSFSSTSTASSSDPVCRFFLLNKCLRGDACPFSHDLTIDPNHNDDDEEAPATVCAPCDLSCSICLQAVLVEGRRFGLLPRCNHLFCLDCILAWRNRVNGSSVVSRESARRCPLCRIPSFFVIPSNRFFVGESKLRRVNEYLEFLSGKPCRYYSEAAEKELCPYGPMCFFHHRSSPLSGGEHQSGLEAKLKLVYTDGSQDVFIN